MFKYFLRKPNLYINDPLDNKQIIYNKVSDTGSSGPLI
jgi:hypothetical protein